jgi:Domain of unknown function (DUF4124)
MSRLSRHLVLVLLAAGVAGSAWGQRIYSCTDAKGRRLTADRPIPECMDREQRELGSNGQVRRTIPPVPTAAERAEQEARQRKAVEDQQRLAEEKRMHKLLVLRYPNQRVHDNERARALQPVADAIASGQRRVAELQEQQQKLRAEAAPYKTPSERPDKLKRQIEENEQHLAAQQRQVAGQEEEKARITLRYEQELVKLKPLWAQQGTTAAAAPPLAR